MTKRIVEPLEEPIVDAYANRIRERAAELAEEAVRAWAAQLHLTPEEWLERYTPRTELTFENHRCTITVRAELQPGRSKGAE